MAEINPQNTTLRTAESPSSNLSRENWAVLFKGAAQILAAQELSRKAKEQGKIAIYSSKADRTRVRLFLNTGTDMTDPRICAAAANIDAIIAKTLEISPQGLCTVFDSTLHNLGKLTKQLPPQAKALAFCLRMARGLGLNAADSIAHQLEKLSNISLDHEFRGKVGIALLQEMLKYEGVVQKLTGQTVEDLKAPDEVDLSTLTSSRPKKAA